MIFHSDCWSKCAFRTESFEIREDVRVSVCAFLMYKVLITFGFGDLRNSPRSFPDFQKLRTNFRRHGSGATCVVSLCGADERSRNPIQESIAVSNADGASTTCSKLSGCGCEIWDSLPPESFPFPTLRLGKVVLLGSTLPVIRSTMSTSLPSTFCVLGAFFPLRWRGGSDGSGGAP